MENKSSMMLNVSILYRYSQKFYEKHLTDYDIGFGQLLFLILIYENEGITMQQLAKLGYFDKSTITKSAAKLEEKGFIKSVVSTSDKRVRNLSTTEKTDEIIAKVYFLRKDWWELLTKGLNDEEISAFSEIQQRMVENTQAAEEELDKDIKIFGIQKLTLLDFPGRMGATIFTGGCNFRCPFCQNSDLVFLPEDMTELDKDDLMDFLKKRKSMLQGVCVSGGEPLLQEGIDSFLAKIKKLGYEVKLDTNGSNPAKLKQLVVDGLVDYVAMDIKNSLDRYGETVGLQEYDTSKVRETAEYLMNGNIPYEFRTTVVKELHTIDDIRKIGSWLKGARAYYLQNFVDSERVIKKGLHACDKSELERFCDEARKYIPNTEIRGI